MRPEVRRHEQRMARRRRLLLVTQRLQRSDGDRRTHADPASRATHTHGK